MILRHDKRTVPQLNTTSTADISFILLVFFLVMTSMDVDKGLQRQLPPMENKPQEESVEISKSNLLELKITAANKLFVDGKPMDVSRLRRYVVRFISQKAAPQRHIISLDVDRKASYDAYFNVQNEIVAAYNQLRDHYALKTYNKVYARCTAEQRKKVRQQYPQRIAETSSSAEEGGTE